MMFAVPLYVSSMDYCVVFLRMFDIFFTSLNLKAGQTYLYEVVDWHLRSKYMCFVFLNFTSVQSYDRFNMVTLIYVKKK